MSSSSASTLGTMAWVIVALGITLALASFGPVRHSWSRRLKKAHGWFYHPDELKSPEPTPEEITAAEPTALIDRIDPRGFDYSIYKERK